MVDLFVFLVVVVIDTVSRFLLFSRNETDIIIANSNKSCTSNFLLDYGKIQGRRS